jgi:hypothetical protein
MPDKEWSQRSEIYPVAASGITGNVKSPVIDMAGAESVMAIAAASATNASNRLAMRMSTASASGGMSDATGETSGISSGGLVLDVYRPPKRFVQFRYSASGATGAAVGLAVIKYGLRSLPSTQPTPTTVKREYAPGSGTASG